MALAGWSAEESSAALGGVLDLAAAGSLELGQASDIVTDTMSAFGMEAQDAGKAADIMAYAQGNANLSVEQLGEALTKAAPAAAAAGMNLEETSAVLGILADNGIKGSRAGTVVDAMLRDIRNSAEDGAIAIGDTSVAVYDAEGNMRSLGEIMRDVEGATSDMTGEQRDNALAAVFQTQAMAGVNTILGEGTDALFDLEDGLYNSKGTAREMAEELMNNLHGSLKKLQSAISEAAISLGNVLLPAINWVVDGIIGAVNWFNGLHDTFKVGIAVTAAVATGLALIIGPLLMLAGFLPGIITGVGMFFTAIKALGGMVAAVAAPILLKVAAIGLLIAAVVLAYQRVDWFRNLIQGAFTAAANAFQAAISFVTDTLLPLGRVFLAVLRDGETMSDWLLYLPESWQGPVQRVVDIIAMLREKAIEIFNSIKETLSNFVTTAKELWSEHGESILEAVTTAYEFVKETIWGAIQAVITFVQEQLQKIKTFWDEHGDSILETINTAYEFVKETIWGAIQAVVTFVQEQLQKIKTFWEENGESIWNTITETYNTIKETVSDGITAVKDFIKEQLEVIKEFWEEHGQQVWQAVQNAFMLVVAVVGGALYLVYSVVKSVIMSVVDFIRNNMDTIQLIFSTVWEIIKNIFITAWEGIKTVISGAINIILGIVKVFTGLFTMDFSLMWEGVKQIFSGALQIIWGVVRTIFTNIWNTAVSIFSAVSEFISGVWTKIVDSVRQRLHRMKLTVMTRMAEIKHNIQTIWREVRELVRDLVSRIWESIKERFQDMVDAIKERMDSAKETINNIWDGIKTFFKETLVEIWNNLKEKFQDMVDSVKEKMGELKEGAINIWNEVQTFFEEIDLFQIGSDIISGLWNGIKSMGSTLKSNITSFIDDNVPGVIKRLLGIASPSRVTTEFGQEIGNGLNNGIDDSGRMITESATNMANNVRDSIAGTLDINGPSGVTTGFGQDTGQGMENGMQNLMGSVTNTAQTMGTNVRNAISGVLGINSPSAVTTAFGRNTGQGLSNGINSMQGAVSSSAQRIAQGVRNAIASTLAIHSPSRVTYQQGRDVGQGMLNGLNSMKSPIERAANSIAATVRRAMADAARLNKITGGSIPKTSSANARNNSASGAMSKYLATIKGNSAARGDYLNDYLMHIPKSQRGAAIQQGARIAQSQGRNINMNHLRRHGVHTLAKGGITTGAAFAMIGEGSEQEAVLPLSRLQSLIDMPGERAERVSIEVRDFNHSARLQRDIKNMKGNEKQPINIYIKNEGDAEWLRTHINNENAIEDNIHIYRESS